jgi:hypothetical protein
MAVKKKIINANDRQVMTAGEILTRADGEIPTSADLRRLYIDAIRTEYSDGVMTEEEILSEVKEMIKDVGSFYSDAIVTVHTPEQRKRMVSTGVSNHGFIEVCFEKATQNAELLPKWLSLEKFEHDLTEFEERQMVFDQATGFVDLASDALLTSSDKAYHNALSFYQSVKTAVKGRVPGAKALLTELSSYFKSRGKRKDEQSPQAPVERQIK